MLQTQKARIDNLSTNTGTTVNDLELQDVRVGADGTTYSNAGEAVRETYGKLSNKITANTTLINDYKKNVDNVMLAKTVSGTAINVSDSADWDVLGIEVEGKTIVTKPNTGLPISPTNVAQLTSVGSPTVVSCGKNLLENKAVSKVDQGLTWTVNSDKSISVKGTALARTYIHLLKSTEQVAFFPSGVTYKVSGIPSNVNLMCYTSDGGYYVMNSSTTWIGKGIKEIYLEVQKDIVLDTTVKPMIEVGTVATEYEPYKASTKVTIPYGLRSTPNGLKNNYKDGFVTMRVGVAIFDGSSDEVIVRSSTQTEGKLRFAIQNDLLIPSVTNTSIANILCNRFIASSAEQNYLNKECVAIDSYGKLLIYYEPISAYTVEEFRAWLQANPLIVYYEHKVYGTYPIPNVLDTYKNVTNINTNATVQPNLTVKYAQDINKVVSDLQKAIIAMGGTINV